MTSASGHYLGPDYFQPLATAHRSVYQQAKPFPHVVIDDFLPSFLLDRVLDELPTDTLFDWQTADAIVGGQRRARLDCAPGETTSKLLQQLNSALFLRFLEQLTSIQNLLCAPEWSDSGFAASSLPVDRAVLPPCRSDSISQRYARQQLDRKLSLLLYLNKDWQEDYGGHLELWNAEMTRCEKRILPRFNRCVIFSTADFCFYGHPAPLNCPEGESRKLIALSYYCQGDRPPASRSLGMPTSPPLAEWAAAELLPEEPRKSKNSVSVLRSGPLQVNLKAR
jgi:hypothetical protein